MRRKVRKRGIGCPGALALILRPLAFLALWLALLVIVALLSAAKY